MKKTRRHFALLLILVLCLNLFPIGAMAAGNSISTATSISIGKSYTGKLTKDNTTDFYKIKLSSAGRLTMNCLNELGSIRYALYDGNGSSIWGYSYYADSSGVNHAQKVWDLTKGVYYIAVSNQQTGVAPTSYGSYTIDLAFTSAKETIAETQGGSNNTLASADDVALEKVYKGQTALNDKKDFYRFTMPAKGTLKIAVSAHNSALHFTVYDASGSTKWQYSYYADSNGVLKVSKSLELAKGRYYFVVTNEGTGNSTPGSGPYAFKLTAITSSSGGSSSGGSSSGGSSSGGSSSTQTSGWVKSGTKWRYRGADGTYAKNAWRLVDGKQYRFDSAGYMITGWAQVYGKWYYFGTSGAMQKGWVKVGGVWYYLAWDGVMQTGWKKIDGTWYYFSGSGAMQTGWQKIGGVWYYFTSSGAMTIGWRMINGHWYYFNGSGAMQTGWQEIGNKWYHFNSSGALDS